MDGTELSTTQCGQIGAKRSPRGIVSFYVEIWHEGLKKHRVIKGDTVQIVEQKARLQCEEWDRRWASLSDKAQQRSEREDGRRQQDERKEEAAYLTEDAAAELDTLSTLLTSRLKENIRVDWDAMKDRTQFSEPAPLKASLPSEPRKRYIGEMPQSSDPKYRPSLGLLDRLLSSRKRKRLDECAARFQVNLQEWNRENQLLEQELATAKKAHAEHVRRIEDVHKAALTQWELKRDAYQARQTVEHQAIDEHRAAYLAKDPQAIIDYGSRVLAQSPYPDYFNLDAQIDYHIASKTLLVESLLPAPDDLPTLKSVKYVASRDEMEESHISDAQRLRLYDDVLYQVTLRTIYELFQTDTVGAIDSIVYNGIVNSIDRRTGLDASACVLSIRANKSDFLAINLSQVDPKACFKSLKGVGSAKLSGLTPVTPVMQMRRDDPRFVSSYEVANTLDHGVNLAAMDWEDFEHLIRELFEKEFAASGGEVKVTQASRDGGVDAVAFDPDPIRGGKIVIQAKRWTNTVGVAAVRDLYGTLINEGATKGILVTTSDYGPDSHNFARGKPLVLLDGGNLLSMLEKHGHRARIDIREARQQKNA